MGYPSELKVVNRKLASNIAIGSAAFSRFNKLNFGARMAVFNFNQSVVIWSAMPYGPEVEKTIGMVAEEPFNITHLIIPDTQHTMAAKSFKDRYPKMQVIAMEGVDVPGLKIDYVINDADGNKLLDKSALARIGLTDPTIVDNFEFVYLPLHGNKELVTFAKAARTVFGADLVFTLGGKLPLEQYSPATGYPANFYPHSGWSFMTRYMQPHSKVGAFLMRAICKPDHAKQGLQTIYDWDFTKFVPCHGNVIEDNARAEFRAIFGSSLKGQ